MGKNKNKKKRGIGKIISIHRNYGFISTDSFGQKGEEIPFEISLDMIKIVNGKEQIEYSEEVSFDLRKGVLLRDKNIREAYNLKFNEKNLILKERITSKPYLQQIREKFTLFNIDIPDSELAKKELTDSTAIIQELKEQGTSEEELQDIVESLNRSNEAIFKTDDDVLYEYLKFKGFQPNMLEYLINGLFLDKNILFKVHRVSDDKQKHYEISDLIKLDEVDIVFREKILKWILGIENAYKSLMSRISTQELGGEQISEKVVLYWKNSTDRTKQEQYKRAKNRYKYLPYSDQYDYITNPDIFPLDDLMSQMDLTSLEGLLTIFDRFSKEEQNISGNSIKSIFPWIRDIVIHKQILRDLRVLRNAAAHGRPILPILMNPDYNPNWDLEFDNPEGRTNIKKWDLFEPLKRMNQIIFSVDEQTSIQIMQPIFGNPYRKAWIELNFIYHRFISLFDNKRYSDFLLESKEFLDYESIDSRTDLEKELYPKLFDIGDTTAFSQTGTPPAYCVLSNEATMASMAADIHRENMNSNIEKYL
ncbi:Abi family protein [Streptococcus sanguinis]|uniref:Abi family protein n=1 Tax=Streptococcus sanguinis TaxID=1305 RepID=UPI001D148D53|nr:Abi family protein [Streptococcus sanguinis]MCC3168269.1 abi-like family protein [Streptococcus sanguinis]